MDKKVVIGGVGMVPFRKPRQSPSYDLMGSLLAKGQREEWAPAQTQNIQYCSLLPMRQPTSPV
jgi:hypothetical protein